VLLIALYMICCKMIATSMIAVLLIVFVFAVRVIESCQHFLTLKSKVLTLFACLFDQSYLMVLLLLTRFYLIFSVSG
jgi:hypothetical protein